MRRYLQQIIQDHLENYDQMIFIAGPRQVGKTTFTQQIQDLFPHVLTKALSWDTPTHREIILDSHEAIIAGLNITPRSSFKNPEERPQNQKPILIFDEIHKYKDFKNFLKGFFDAYKHTLRIIVTGSAKLDIYRAGQDSLMGRYFLYRLHPCTLGELNTQRKKHDFYYLPEPVSEENIQSLLQFGGFPQPLTRNDSAFHKRWQLTKRKQLIYDEIKTLAHIHEIGQLEVLASLLQDQAGQLTKYSSLSDKIRVSEPTVRRWIDVLQSFYFCYKIPPYSNKLSNMITKEPKVYLWDWSIIEDEGARRENFIASHLLKAVHYWTDTGLGDCKLHFLRTKDGREVDFLITNDRKPWIMIETKSSKNAHISPSFYHFYKHLNPQHAFQLAFNYPHWNTDCFEKKAPTIVPASTFLSQLI